MCNGGQNQQFGPCPALSPSGWKSPRGNDGRLAGLRLVEARLDARVQVADVVAGAARKIASDELNGRGDPKLTALLGPYVDAYSIWGDARSRALLAHHTKHG